MERVLKYQRKLKLFVSSIVKSVWMVVETSDTRVLLYYKFDAELNRASYLHEKVKSIFIHWHSYQASVPGTHLQ